LRQLADDELGHEKLLLSHLSALGINSPPPDERPEPGTRQPAQQMLFNLFQKGRETARWATTATEALRIAFALETRGERFFASWAEKTTDKEGRHLLDFLTSEEVRHASILKERYRSLTGEDPQPFPEDYQRIPWPDI
jgi:rubrerythrin